MLAQVLGHIKGSTECYKRRPFASITCRHAIAARMPAQVSVHIKGSTECYECHPPASTQKTYPICTLRNTPDKPIHCVVWAKELLFPRLFGKVEVSGESCN
jgi:hypothetical protein